LKRSILTERIARRGLHLTREYGIDPFLDTRVGAIMAAPVDTLEADMPVGDVIAFFADLNLTLHRSYPVVDEGSVIAMVSRADALRWSRESWPANAMLRDACAGKPLLVGYDDELVAQLADRMTAADVGRVPILERGSERLVGIVARRDLLRTRTRVAHEEGHRSRMLGFARKGDALDTPSDNATF
jgi:CBS domain-containing protein